MKQAYCYTFLVCLLLFTSCKTTNISSLVIPSVTPHLDTQASLQSTNKSSKTNLSSTSAEKIIADKASTVLFALHNQDMRDVSEYVHPHKGLRFSLKTFVQESDLIFSAEQVEALLEDDTIYKWGTGYFGDGDDSFIKLTFEEYYKKFIYRYDFVDAKQIGYNEIIGKGNTINNIFDFYPQSIVVEYYFPGLDPKYGGLDWASLRLVFQEEAGDWYLVGFVQDGYTP